MSFQRVSYGFSLIELLLSVVLFGAFFVAIYQIFPVYSLVMHRSQSTSVETSLAQEVMEKYLQKGPIDAYHTIQTTCDPSLNGNFLINSNCEMTSERYSSDSSSSLYKYFKTVDLVYIDPNTFSGTQPPTALAPGTTSMIIRVTVTISYTLNGSVRSNSLVTYVTSLTP